MGLRGRNNLTNCTCFFITTTVLNFLNVFRENKPCQLLLDNIKHYQKKYNFSILAYVIMPSHFHWIVKINSKYGSVTDIMRDVKKYSAWDIMQYLSCKSEIYKGIFNDNAKEYLSKQNRKFWMDRFYDEVIRSDQMFWDKLIYLHNNPVKANLVKKPEDFIYSSARNYILGDQSIIEVDSSFPGIMIR
jgi:REP element-mobilizing transposase RayT